MAPRGHVYDAIADNFFTPEEHEALLTERAERDLVRRDYWDDDTWLDPRPYCEDLRRFSAQFARLDGPQVVCGGDEVRERDGVVKRWAYVAGEFEAR